MQHVYILYSLCNMIKIDNDDDDDDDDLLDHCVADW